MKKILRSALLLFVSCIGAVTSAVDLNHHIVLPDQIPAVHIDPIQGILNHTLAISPTAIRALKIASLIGISLGITSFSLWNLYKTLTQEEKIDTTTVKTKVKKNTLSPWAKKALCALLVSLCGIGLLLKADTIVDGCAA